MRHTNSTCSMCKCVYYSVDIFFLHMHISSKAWGESCEAFHISACHMCVFQCVWAFSLLRCCSEFSILSPSLLLSSLFFLVSVRCPLGWGGWVGANWLARQRCDWHRRALHIKATTITATATHSCVVSPWGFRHTTQHQPVRPSENHSAEWTRGQKR